MNKEEFLTKLRKKLSGLPKEELEERVTFYREIIDDRMEAGLSEEEAVAEFGDVVAEVPPEEVPQRKKGPEPWVIVLLVLGSPVWFSLLIAAVSVVFSGFVVLWSLVISAWAVGASLVGVFLGCMVMGVVMLAVGKSLAGIGLFGFGLFIAGTSVFAFFGCRAATMGGATLTKRMVQWICGLITRRGAAK